MKIASAQVPQIKAYGEELEWWKEFMGSENLELMIKRADPAKPVIDSIAQYMRDENDVILDVGAGPLTQVGYTFNGKKVKVVAVDPLADSYNTIPFPVERPVVTQFCFGESLSDTLPKDNFDIAFARNSLDHSIDPLKCFYEILKLLKSGGYMILNHCMNEGRNASYTGLHQWDFFTTDGSFFISSAKRQTIVNVTDHLGYVAEQVDIQATTVPCPFAKTDLHWVNVVFRKR